MASKQIKLIRHRKHQRNKVNLKKRITQIKRVEARLFKSEKSE